jgi:hypothetical protein
LYTTPVAKAKMRERRDGPTVRDTLTWFALIFLSGYLV